MNVRIGLGRTAGILKCIDGIHILVTPADLIVEKRSASRWRDTRWASDSSEK